MSNDSHDDAVLSLEEVFKDEEVLRLSLTDAEWEVIIALAESGGSSAIESLRKMTRMESETIMEVIKHLLDRGHHLARQRRGGLRLRQVRARRRGLPIPRILERLEPLPGAPAQRRRRPPRHPPRLLPPHARVQPRPLHEGKNTPTPASNSRKSSASSPAPTRP